MILAILVCPQLTLVDTWYILILEVIKVYTTIQKWGNSQAVRIPKSILEKAKLQESDQVELRVQEGNVIIIPVGKRKSLAERIAEYEGDYVCQEWDTEKPVGKEIW